MRPFAFAQFLRSGSARPPDLSGDRRLVYFNIIGSNNLIIRNSARGNQGFNYRFGPQNTFGPIVIAPGTNAQEVNDGTFQTRGGNIGSTDPYANIFY